jgi:transcriptional regulator
MYIPHHYKEEDRSKLLAFMRAHSFAILVSGDGELHATHLPFLIEEKSEDIFLVSHLAKANPQWKKFNERISLLAIFSGPHGYVSPSNYEKQQNVPTWNYVAVHAYGTAKIIEEKDTVTCILEKTINNYEKEYFDQWQMLAQDYKDKMIKGIVAFEIKVTRLEGKYKLSQNKTGKEQRNIVHYFEKQKDSVSEELASLMKKNLPA